jgi:hypothetical protein
MPLPELISFVFQLLKYILHSSGPENFRIFSGASEPNYCYFRWETTGSRRDNSAIFRAEELLPFSIGFQGFLARNGDFYKLSGPTIFIFSFSFTITIDQSISITSS